MYSLLFLLILPLSSCPLFPLPSSFSSPSPPLPGRDSEGKCDHVIYHDDESVWNFYVRGLSI